MRDAYRGRGGEESSGCLYSGVAGTWWREDRNRISVLCSIILTYLCYVWQSQGPFPTKGAAQRSD